MLDNVLIQINNKIKIKAHQAGEINSKSVTKKKKIK